MSEIAVVKGIELYKNAVISLLTKKMEEHTFSIYNPKESEALFRNNQMADLVFIDVASQIDLNRTIHFYKKKKTRIAILVPEITKDQMLDLFKLDLDGYFCERMDVEEITFGISIVLKGEKYIHPYLSRYLYEDYLRLVTKKNTRPIKLLTKREWQILEEMAKGNTNEQIAQNLGISDKTVKNHVTSILRKLQVKDRTNAILKALKKGWVNQDFT